MAKDVEKHKERVNAGLTRAYADPGTAEQTFDIGRDKLIIFSDHHRGTKDGADDFWRCERSYRAALGHYFEHGHRLILLGDVEELWENKPTKVVSEYRDTLLLEQEFHSAGRLERFWGNHDDNWRHGDEVQEHFRDLSPDLVVHEAMRIRIMDGREELGLFFLVHGHQGTLDSDRYGQFSRLVVRHAWRPLQRRLKMPSTTPSRDFNLREGHNDAMFHWAKYRPERLILIAGHTHQPVFSTPDLEPERKPEIVGEELRLLRESGGADPARLAALRAEYELVRTEQFGDPPKAMELPCYFNTGCCSYGDGDVTGLEIVDEEIRLVRWLNDEAKPEVKKLACKPLREVIEAVKDSHLN
jgi:hypothetical protein